MKIKNIVISYILVLAILFIFLSIVSERHEYSAEKLLYKAMRVYNKIKLNPDVIPPKMINYVMKNLERIISGYPSTNAAKSAYIALSEAYMLDKKYDKALQTIDVSIGKYKDDPSFLSNVHFLKGIAYERQNKWSLALKEFELLKDKFSDTPVGLQSPLYVAGYYEKNGKSADAERELNSAANFYEGIAKENKGGLKGYAASGFLLETYKKLDKYEEAGRVLEDIIKNYPSRLTLMQYLPQTDSIFVDKLKQPDKAIEIYTYIKNNSSDEKLKNFLENKITSLKDKKKL